MFIADAQVHIWAPNTPERPWAPGNVHREVPLEADEVLREMDAAGVSRTVLVPPTIDADRNDLALAAAHKHPDRFAVMGRLDPDAPGARGTIADWRRQPGMLGLRYSLYRPKWITILNEGRVDWVWAEAEKAGIPVMMLITHSMAPQIDRIAERHPGLKLVMDHLALSSDEYDEHAFRDLDKLLALAKRPNVAVKASALPCYTKDSYPIAACIRTSGAFTTRSARSACSGAPITRGCRVLTVRRSRCLPRRFRGSPLRTRSG